MAHARRKFFDLHATNKSQIAEKSAALHCALLRPLIDTPQPLLREGREAPGRNDFYN